MVIKVNNCSGDNYFHIVDTLQELFQVIHLKALTLSLCGAMNWAEHSGLNLNSESFLILTQGVTMDGPFVAMMMSKSL